MLNISAKDEHFSREIQRSQQKQQQHNGIYLTFWVLCSRFAHPTALSKIPLISQ